MTKSIAVQNALTLDSLKFPDQPKVVGIEVDDYVDHAGEDALMVWVLLDEDTEVSRVKGENLLAISREIHDKLLASDINLFPYTQMIKPSGRAEILANA